MRLALLVSLLSGCSLIYSSSEGKSDDGGGGALLEDVRSVAAGAYHTCAVAGDDRRLYCWGHNNFGQLGVGDTEPRGRARHVELPGPVDVLRAGAGHTCAIVDNTLYCWGAGSHGQTGFDQDQSLPRQVADTAFTDVAISAGSDTSGNPSAHTCAIDTEGRLWCWGAGFGGQLGDGSTSNRSVPALVPGMVEVTSVALGDRHSCAVSQGDVYCWGNDNEAQLGIEGDATTASPAPIAGVEDAVRLTASERGTCAELASGKVHCWGQNLRSGLGVDTWEIETPAETNHHVSIELGPISGCSFELGAPRCWGDNIRGRFGDLAVDLVDPVRLSPREDVVAVAHGLAHACYLFASGQVGCAGAHGYGLLGRGGQNEGVVGPMQLSSGDAAQAVAVSVSMGWLGGCAERAGAAALCWGLNVRGRNGDGSADRWSDGFSISGALMTSVSSSSRHSCAVTGGDSTCWGSDEVGALGDGELNQSGAPPHPTVSFVNEVVEVAAGHLVSCAIVAGAEPAENNLFCWGAADDYRLGFDSENSSVDSPFLTSVGPGARLVALSPGGGHGFLGEVHGCAVLAGGGLQCWGANAERQLGDPQASADDALPIDVASPCSGNEKQLALGGEHSCLLCNSGAVHCWGRNDRGQLGLGHTATVASPTEVSSLPPVEFIAASRENTCAVLQNGYVYCWGANESQQVGPEEGDHVEPALVELPLGGDFVAVSIAGPDPFDARYFAGRASACAAASDGAIVCWGDDFNGQLGDAAEDHSLEAQFVRRGD